MEKDGRINDGIINEEELSAFEMSNISLRLNSYEDIFSSFDPRPYSERSLSVDFIEEAKRASTDKVSGEIELRLILSQKSRKLEIEKIIRKRLKSHFERHVKIVKKEYGDLMRNGIYFITAGIITMFIAAFFLYKSADTSAFMNFLLILFEPAGWFFFWEGLYQIIFESKNKKPDIEFNKKLAKRTIIFLSY